MRTGNKSTNDGTGQRYEQVFHQNKMKDEKRIISHAKNESGIDIVIGKNGKKYSISEALEKRLIGFKLILDFFQNKKKIRFLIYVNMQLLMVLIL